MKKVLLPSLFLAILCLGLLPANAQSSYVRSYEQTGGSPYASSPAAVIKCSNGDLLISWNDQAGYAVITRVDAVGNSIWSTSLGDQISITSHTIQSMGENSDGTIWVFGHNRSASYQQQYFITELSATGTKNWDKFYYATDEYMYGLPSCVKMYDDGYMINLSVSSHMQVLRTDADGNLQWGKVFKTDSSQYKHPGFAGTSTYDGGFVMTSKENNKTALVKIDLAGNTVWGFSFEAWTNAYCHPKTIAQLPDGSVITGGSIDSYAFLMQVDLTGTITWIKTYTSPLVTMGGFHFIHPAADGSFYALGSSDGFLTRDAADFMLHLDGNGNVIGAADYINPLAANDRNAVSYMSPANELYLLEGQIWLGAPIELAKINPGFEASCNVTPLIVNAWSVAVPTMSSIQHPVYTANDGVEVPGSLSLYPITVDMTIACVATSVAEPIAITNLQLFPNPATSGAAIRYTTTVAGRWTVTDATGRTVLEGRATAGTQQLPTETLSSGLYIFRLTDETGQVQQEKLLID